MDLTVFDQEWLSCLLKRALERLKGESVEYYQSLLAFIVQQKSQTVRRSSLKTRAGWSPFEGCTFRGLVSHTIVRGKIYPQIEE